MSSIKNINNPQNIYFFRPDLPQVDTSTLFTVTKEGKHLRVQNKHVNCLFRHLTRGSFDKLYNDFNRHLNLNFEPLHLNKQVYALTKDEQAELAETIITSWLFYYTVNNLPVTVNRADFEHPYMVDYVLYIIDKKYGIDTQESLALGATILRQDPDRYTRTVKGRRLYYDK